MCDDHDDDDPDLDGEHETVLGADTLPEGVDYLGDYESLEAYFRSQFEDQINAAVHWLMDCLDWSAVRGKMEAGRYRYLLENGSVYRVDACVELLR